MYCWASVTSQMLEGMDDYNSNWFLDFQNDYEVETTILTIPEYTDYKYWKEQGWLDKKRPWKYE